MSQAEYIKTQVRLPKAVHEAIKERADKEDLSMNEMMVRLLRAALAEGMQAKNWEQDIEQRLEALERLIADKLG